LAYLPDCLAIVFDFDDTLLPDSTTLLLEKHQIDPRNFWGKEVKNLIDLGFDPPHAYLRQLLKNIGKGKPLGLLTNQRIEKIRKEFRVILFPWRKDYFQRFKSHRSAINQYSDRILYNFWRFTRLNRRQRLH
jgi:FMN phosphatase YigB (HAD superfamily)